MGEVENNEENRMKLAAQVVDGMDMKTLIEMAKYDGR